MGKVSKTPVATVLVPMGRRRWATPAFGHFAAGAGELMNAESRGAGAGHAVQIWDQRRPTGRRSDDGAGDVPRDRADPPSASTWKRLRIRAAA